MSCITLKSGADYSCGGFQKKYFQQIVLVNKKDVISYNIQISKESLLPDFNMVDSCRHRVRFQLKEGKKGFRYTFPEKGSLVSGSFTKSEDNNRTEYSHRITLALYGVNEAFKCKLRELDNGNYFGAIQFMDGTVEIYGFEYGLKTNDYTFEPQAFLGGSVIELISDKDALEDEAPLIYFSNGNENEDFNNDFDSNPPIILGDFNDDFNNDFYTEAI